MLSFLKKGRPDPYGVIHEQWKSSFKWHQKKRLIEEETPGYSSGIRHSVFTLELKKQNCLAWVTSRLYKYRDFILEGRISIDKENGYSAAGFIFRSINDENLYYFLISNKGYFRFDVIFNRNPIHLIEWTECPLLGKKEVDLRVIAHGSVFSFFIDDEWIAEIHDETIPEGSFGFAAQNFSEKDRANVYLHRILIESRPAEVEKAYYRWVHYVPVRPEFRVTLAGTFFSTGRYLDAVIMLKKALKGREGRPDEYFLLAESYLNLRIYDKALQSIEEFLKREPESSEALLEKANLLYLMKEFIKARDYVQEIVSQFSKNSSLWNLLGNSEYALGNWDKAYQAYQKAADLDPEIPLFRINLARVYERLDQQESAFLTYLTASRLLFRQEAYEDLADVLPRARKIMTRYLSAGAPEGKDQEVKGRKTNSFQSEYRELLALEGKMFFHEGRRDEPEKLFAQLIESGYQDSAVFFLYGLILIEKGDREPADVYLQKAAEMESGYFLYWFRLAENRFLLGRDPAECLSKAYELNPGDPWVNNLMGQCAGREGRFNEAGRFFKKALKLAPEEADIYLNFSDSLMRQGKPDKALAVISDGISSAGENPRLFNQRGNLYAKLNNFTAALTAYEKALQLEPENSQFMENCAACCLELDMIMRAEELLSKLLTDSPSPSVYNLTGNLAVVKREYKRAELSFKEALKLEENSEVQLNLTALYLERGRYREAKKLLDQVLGNEPELRKALALQDELRNKYENRIACAACNREWWVPVEIPPQKRLIIHGEPPSAAPAGKCENCGQVFCIQCAVDHVKDKRFICPDCGKAPLKLADDHLKYLILQYLDKEDQG